MSSHDYRSCDLCGDEKVFYDANLSYEQVSDENPAAKEKGEPQCYSLDYLGDWVVLCQDCAQTHSIKIVKHKAKEAKP